MGFYYIKFSIFYKPSSIQVALKMVYKKLKIIPNEKINFYTPWNHWKTYGTTEGRSKLTHLNSPKFPEAEFGDDPFLISSKFERIWCKGLWNLTEIESCERLL